MAKAKSGADVLSTPPWVFFVRADSKGVTGERGARVSKQVLWYARADHGTAVRFDQRDQQVQTLLNHHQAGDIAVLVVAVCGHRGVHSLLTTGPLNPCRAQRIPRFMTSSAIWASKKRAARKSGSSRHLKNNLRNNLGN